MAIVEDPPPAYHTFRHVGTQMPLSTSCVGRGINEPLLLRTISELDLQARTPSDGDLANAYFGRGAATAAGFTGGGDDDVEAGYVGAERGGNNCCNNNNNNNSGIQPFDASVPSSPRWPAMESAKTLALTCVLLVVLLATAVASLGLVLLLEQEHWSPM
ncbi:RNA-dependent RNA polymerase 1 [Purpureocillium lavendulum]|uniref:RNA-dependent RNA polymerase 1 n=1 Tax=Purpureocillium lavendulum TaxID=1247861 RepID=A0AB34FZ20_9HYPO|nr:RNA-dependent RNA polymerase 1 [Purpureocillium lavendulum]